MSVSSGSKGFIAGMAQGAWITLGILLGLYAAFLILTQLHGSRAGWVLVATDVALIGFLAFRPWRFGRLSQGWGRRVLVFGIIVLVALDLFATWVWLKA